MFAQILQKKKIEVQSIYPISKNKACKLFEVQEFIAIFGSGIWSKIIILELQKKKEKKIEVQGIYPTFVLS